MTATQFLCVQVPLKLHSESNGSQEKRKRLCKRWEAEEDEFVLKNHATMTCKKMGDELGRTESQVRNRCWLKKLPFLCSSHPKAWSASDIERLCAAYKDLVASENLNLQSLADLFGRDKANVCRKARELGLTNQNRAKLINPKGPPPPKYATKQEHAEAQSKRVKELWKQVGHPKGSLGMKHTADVKLRLSETSRAWWSSLPEDEKDDFVLKRLKARRSANTPPTPGRGSWKAGWREVGGKRCYFRSRWEANYARYLEWLRSIGHIASWEHEPHTFWFDGIKRGCVSYLPDFRVTNLGGEVEWHEVKGWMDARSKTTIARMAKYHPKEKLIVIREKQYREIQIKVSTLIQGWES